MNTQLQLARKRQAPEISMIISFAPMIPQNLLPEGLKSNGTFQFLVNPQSMNINYTTNINFTKARNDYIPDAVNSEPVELNFSAQCLSFQSPIDYGLTNELQTASESFNNIRQFIDIYRSNGRIFNKGSGSNIIGNTKVIHSAFDVSIIYNLTQYLGSFTDMNYSDTADTPYLLKFAFKFKAFKVVELHRYVSANMLQAMLSGDASNTSVVKSYEEFIKGVETFKATHLPSKEQMQTINQSYAILLHGKKNRTGIKYT